MKLIFKNGVTVPRQELVRLRVAFHKDGSVRISLVEDGALIYIENNGQRFDRLQVAQPGTMTPDLAESIVALVLSFLVDDIIFLVEVAKKGEIARFRLHGASPKFRIRKKRRRCYEEFLKYLKRNHKNREIVLINKLGRDLMSSGLITRPEWEYILGTCRNDGVLQHSEGSSQYSTARIYFDRIEELLAITKFC
ncbi:MAG: hypothetical protein ABH826_05260 [Patescibacteria group bacterium]|nr:hypothetical protein [Patescibacteria group bacterium]